MANPILVSGNPVVSMHRRELPKGEGGEEGGQRGADAARALTNKIIFLNLSAGPPKTAGPKAGPLPRLDPPAAAGLPGGGVAGSAADVFTDPDCQETPPQRVVWDPSEGALGQPIGAAERAFIDRW